MYYISCIYLIYFFYNCFCAVISTLSEMTLKVRAEQRGPGYPPEKLVQTCSWMQDQPNAAWFNGMLLETMGRG